MAYYVHLHQGSRCKGVLGPFETKGLAQAQAEEWKQLAPTGTAVSVTSSKAHSASKKAAKRPPLKQRVSEMWKASRAQSGRRMASVLPAVEALETALAVPIGAYVGGPRGAATGLEIARAGADLRRGFMGAPRKRQGASTAIVRSNPGRVQAWLYNDGVVRGTISVAPTRDGMWRVWDSGHVVGDAQRGYTDIIADEMTEAGAIKTAKAHLATLGGLRKNPRKASVQKGHR